MKKIAFVFVSLFFMACTQVPEVPSIVETIHDKKIIVALGDSLTAGMGVSEELNYPSLLQKKIDNSHLHYTVKNVGISGDTTSGVLNRLEWVQKLNPDIVILEIGANDALRGIDTAFVRKNLEETILFFQKEEVTIILVGIEALKNQGGEYGSSFHSIYPELAEKYSLPFMPLFWEQLLTRPDLIQSDGIHPTAEGYELIVDDLWDYVLPVL